MFTITTYRKTASPWIKQVLTWILVLYCYYQGLHKFLSFESYNNWLQYRPQIAAMPQVFAYGVPALHLLIALALTFTRSRIMALYGLALVQLLFLYWIFWGRNTGYYLSFPWHSWWGGPLNNWFYKIWESIIVAWLTIRVIFINTNRKHSNQGRWS